MCVSVFAAAECQQQRKEATSASGDREKNATQLLTQYDLLSSGLGTSRTDNTSSEEVREPQQELGEGDKEGGTSEEELDQMVNSPVCVCVVHLFVSLCMCVMCDKLICSSKG